MAMKEITHYKKLEPEKKVYAHKNKDNGKWVITHPDGCKTSISDKKFKKRYSEIEEK